MIEININFVIIGICLMFFFKYINDDNLIIIKKV